MYIQSRTTYFYCALLPSSLPVFFFLFLAYSCSDNDSGVVGYAMRLLVLAVLHSPLTLLSTLYNTPKFDQFLLTSLLQCQDASIRSEVEEGLYHLCSSINISNGNNINNGKPVSSPHSYFLKFLLAHLPDHMTKDPLIWTSCGQYFHLLDR